MKLTDKDSLIEHMRKAYEGNKKNGFKWDLECAVVVIECEEEINRPIVRCKDCKYWAEFTFNIPPFHYCGRLFQDGNTESIGFYMEADDFCSRGERRDD